MNLGVLFFSENSDRRTRVWSGYSSICKCHQSGLLSAPVSDTLKKKKTKTCDKDPSNQHGLKGPRSSDTLRRAHLPFKDRLSTTVSDCVHQCDAVLTGSVRGPHQKQTQVIRTALCSAGPPPPSFKHPQGPPRVRRTATAPLQGGRADCGAPAM